MKESFAKGIADERLDATDDGLERIRLLRIGSTAAAVVWTGVALLAWHHGSDAWLIAMLVCVLVSALGPVVGRFAGHDVGGSYFSIVIIAGLTTVGALRGGVESSVAQWNVLLPLLAVLGNRPRKALFWTLLCVVEVLGLVVAERAGSLPPRMPATQLGPVLSTFGLFVVVAWVGLLYHRARVVAFAQYSALQRELFQSQKLDGLGRLAGGIAHDFNNLLSVIRTHADLAAIPSASDAERLEDLEAIGAAARQGAALTSDLLAFAGGVDNGSTESLHPGDVARDVGRLLHRVLPKNVRLEIHVDPASGEVMASHRQLHQVLMNLCLNAKEALPNGGTIRVSIDPVASPPAGLKPRPTRARAYVRMRVDDDGMGMTERTRGRMLEPFFSTKLRGTGLGLATVQRIVQDHQGVLDVTSRPGIGSTFDVYLPVLPEAKGAAALEHQ